MRCVKGGPPKQGVDMNCSLAKPGLQFPKVARECRRGFPLPSPRCFLAHVMLDKNLETLQVILSLGLAFEHSDQVVDFSTEHPEAARCHPGYSILPGSQYDRIGRESGCVKKEGGSGLLNRE